MDNQNYWNGEERRASVQICRAQAAIDLKVPRSGIPELDAMIRESRRLDMATAAMVALIDARTPNGFGSGWPTHVERDAVLLADALLAASEKERGE